MSPHGLFALFVALFGFVESLVFVDVFTFQHQKAPSLAFIAGPAG